MTDAKKPGPFDYLALAAATPATRNYLFIAGACLALNFFILAGEGIEMVAILATLIAVPGIAAKWVISPFLYLAVIGYNLFDPGFFGLIGGFNRFSSRSMGGQPRIEQLLLAASTFGYLVCQFRLLSYWTEVLPSRLKRKGKQPLRHDGPQPRPLDNATEAESLRLLWELPALLAGAFLLHMGVHTVGDFVDRSTVPLERNLAMVGLLVLTVVSGWAVAWIASAYLGVDKYARQVARLALMDILFQETRREQQRMQRWRLWNRERAVRKGRGGIE